MNLLQIFRYSAPGFTQRVLIGYPSSHRLQRGVGICGICNANFQLKNYFEMEYEKGVANAKTT